MCSTLLFTVSVTWLTEPWNMWEQPFPLVSARFWTALTARAPKLGATGAEASGIAESHVTVMKRRASRTLLKLETAHVSRAPGWERLHVEL